MENENELADTQSQEEEFETDEVENQEEEEETSEETSEESEEGESETDYKALYEKEKKAKEKEMTMRQGMVKKLQALTTTKKSEPTIQKESSSDTDRLDRLELRQIDDKLTAEEIKEILVTKKTRGLSDAVEAYNLPMVQAWLKETRASTEKKEKIEKAIPKTQGGGSNSQPARQNIKKEWSKGMGSNLQEVASILEKEILGN